MTENRIPERPYTPWAKVFPNALVGFEDIYIPAVNRWLGVYQRRDGSGKLKEADWSFYWPEESNPIQHNMNLINVLGLISYFLDPSNEEEIKRNHSLPEGNIE